jgi:glycosyltransferase involved in cell wall biosynthesis
MRILVINHYAGSEQMGMEYRPFYLAREWRAGGHSVTLMAADYSHLRARQPAVGTDLERTEEEGVIFRWLRTNTYVGNGVGRVANMLAFVGKLRAHAGQIAREERPDILICSSTYPLDIYAGARIARKANARLVFEVHDLWPLTPVLLGGYSTKHPYIRLLQRAEDWAYRNSDVVVSILPHPRDYMLSRGLEPGKFVHVPNGVPVSKVLTTVGDLPRPIKAQLDVERASGRFLIGYSGGFNLSNSLETLLEAARLLRRSGVTFLLVGDGPESGKLRAQLSQSELDNFHLLGRIPKSTVRTFLLQMDALAITWRCSPLYRFGVSPNKLFDYMLAGKPILQACEASNDLVAEADCGFTVPPEDPAAFAKAILRLRELPARERERLGENAQRFVIHNHDYRILARRFLEAVSPARSI